MTHIENFEVENRRVNTAYFLLLSIIVFIIFSPIFLANSAFWDEVIGEYAIYRHDYKIIADFVNENNWYLAYVTTWLRGFISSVLPIDQHVLSNTFTLAVFVLFAFEVRRFCQNFMKMTWKESSCVSLFVALYPAWHILFMSWFQIWLFCCFAFLTAYRLISYKHWIVRSVGYVLLLLSFQLNSIMFFLPAIIASDILVNARSKAEIVAIILRGMVPVCCALIAALFLLAVHPVNGLYLDYNRITLPTNSVNIQILLNALIGFSNLLINFAEPMVLAIVTLGFCYLGSRYHKVIPASADYGADEYLKKDTQYVTLPNWNLAVRRLAACVLMIIGAITPYVLVGKFEPAWYFVGWEDRHGILLAMPIAIFGVTLVSLAERGARQDFRPWIFLVLMGSSLLFNFWFLSQGIAAKLSVYGFKQSLMQALLTVPAPEPGIIRINTVGIPDGIPVAFYDMNWLFVQAYGKAEWFVVKMPDTSGNEGLVPKAIQNSRVYRDRYVMSDFSMMCITNALFRGHNYSTYELLLYLFVGKSLRPASIEWTDKTCMSQ